MAETTATLTIPLEILDQPAGLALLTVLATTDETDTVTTLLEHFPEHLWFWAAEEWASFLLQAAKHARVAMYQSILPYFLKSKESYLFPVFYEHLLHAASLSKSKTMLEAVRKSIPADGNGVLMYF